MLEKIKKLNKLLFLLILLLGISATGLSFYSDLRNGDVEKGNLLRELGGRIFLTGKVHKGIGDFQSNSDSDVKVESQNDFIGGDEIGSLVTLKSSDLGFTDLETETQEAKDKKLAKDARERQIKKESLSANFSFVAIGDSESYSKENGYDSELKDVLERAKDEKSDFLLFTGDIIAATGGRQAISGKISDVNKLIKKYHNNYYIAFGKHDLECGNFCVAQWKREMFGGDVSERDPGVMFHSFDYQNTHFVLLSTDWPKKHTIDQVQFEWLKKDLETIDRGKTPHVIVVQHVPPITFFYKSAKKCHDMSCDKVMQNKLFNLYKKNKVDLVLSGHEHDFSHKEKDGIDFVIVGSSGQSTRNDGSPEGDIYSVIKIEGRNITLKSYEAKKRKLVKKIIIK